MAVAGRVRERGHGRRATAAPAQGSRTSSRRVRRRCATPSPRRPRHNAGSSCSRTSRAGPPRLGRLATQRGDALERWLRHAFGDPERFADEILLARMSAERPGSPAHEIVAALRILRDAEVAAGAVEHAELAVNRRVLLEQAVPWRYFSGDLLTAAVQAVRAWQRRYRLAYERHYRAISGRAATVAQELRAALPAAEAVRRRLASETVRAVLARPGVPDLDRLLQAIAASDLDGIERVLSEDLAAHIDRLLREAREPPLAALAMRVPRVTAESLDEAVLAFRAILEEALAEATDGTVWLREDRAAAEA